jgi:UDP-N-acetylglucosamine 2-epimerase (non-hydrolysing)
MGTRPEAIKMAPVVEGLDGWRPLVETRLALTGQHTELVDRVLDAFGLLPDYDLGIMREGQSLYDVAHECLDGLRDVMRDFKPDMVLVQGDTASVFFGSLVAFFEGTAVGHVEAGLRSGDKRAPFPEEMFRRLTDVLSDIYFAPTSGAREKLLAEGVPGSRIHVTGNTVVDALRTMAAKAPRPGDPRARALVESDAPLVLLTAHRRESFGEPLARVFRAVRKLAEGEDEIQILYPVHPNPRVRGPAREILSGHPRVHLVDPLAYGDLISVLARASLVLTDSGGIQEEAPTFGVPVLVLREVTERPEGVEAGVARLVGTDPDAILAGAREILAAKGEAEKLGSNPYGDGRAGTRIADIVGASLTGRGRETSDWDGA